MMGVSLTFVTLLSETGMCQKCLNALSIAFFVLNFLSDVRASIGEPNGKDFVGKWRGKGRDLPPCIVPGYMGVLCLTESVQQGEVSNRFCDSEFE